MSKPRFSFLGVLVVGCAVAIVALTAGWGYVGKSLFGGVKQVAEQAEAVPKAPVAVIDVAPGTVEIVDSYHGMIRPLERFNLAFDVSGRIETLGTNTHSLPLDEGDTVAAGQLLAQLDRRVFTARLKEAQARLEQAQFDMKQAERLRAGGNNTITEAEFQDWVTKLTTAQAQQEMAAKNLLDATLFSPVDGVISKRLSNVGESVNMHQTVMEVIQVDRVLLVVGVPESRIAAIRVGQKAHVQLLARGGFGDRSAPVDGEVRRVAEAADDRSGLFEVEIELENKARALRPGQVAVARIVVDQIEGFRLPVQAALVREGRTILFAVDSEGKAQPFAIGPAREQEGELILRELPEPFRRVVVRGQHRLVPDREVEILAPDADEEINRGDAEIAEKSKQEK